VIYVTYTTTVKCYSACAIHASNAAKTEQISNILTKSQTVAEIADSTASQQTTYSN